MPDLSTKPYLIRAIHEWCTDSGHTPYLAVSVDERTVVPRAYVKGGEIVLNVSYSATNGLRIGNDLIEFQARFGGVAHELSIPIDNVSAIYARENGHGMAFDVPKAPAVVPETRPQEEPPRRGPRLATSDGAAMANANGVQAQADPAAPAPAAAPTPAPDQATAKDRKSLSVLDPGQGRRRGRVRDAGASARPDAPVPATPSVDTPSVDTPSVDVAHAPVVPAEAAVAPAGTDAQVSPTSTPQAGPTEAGGAPDASKANGPVVSAPDKGSDEGDGPKDGAPSSRRGGRPRLTRVK